MSYKSLHPVSTAPPFVECRNVTFPGEMINKNRGDSRRRRIRAKSARKEIAESWLAKFPSSASECVNNNNNNNNNNYYYYYVCVYIYIYIYIYFFPPPVEVAVAVAVGRVGASGVHKGGFSTGGLSNKHMTITHKHTTRKHNNNNKHIIMIIIIITHLLNPLCELPRAVRLAAAEADAGEGGEPRAR